MQLQIAVSVARLHVSMHILDAAPVSSKVWWYLVGLPQWLTPRRTLIASKVLYRRDFYNALLAYFSKFIYIHVHDAVTHIFHFSPTHHSPDRNRMLCNDVCVQAWGPWKLQLCSLISDHGGSPSACFKLADPYLGRSTVCTYFAIILELLAPRPQEFATQPSGRCTC